MEKVVSEKEKPGVRKFLRPDEANRLIEAAGKRGRYPVRDKVLVRMVYRHGLRASEAVGVRDGVPTGMRWDQLDLDGGTLTVHRAKGGKTSTHTLERDELRDLRKLRKDVTGLRVFESERGTPLSVDALQDIVRQAGKLAGLGDKIHPHMLRHAAGYALINQGEDVRVVQDFLGHRNINSTALYTELSPARLAKVRVR